MYHTGTHGGAKVRTTKSCTIMNKKEIGVVDFRGEVAVGVRGGGEYT